jgi:hypothetical protein
MNKLYLLANEAAELMARGDKLRTELESVTNRLIEIRELIAKEVREQHDDEKNGTIVIIK